MPPRLFGLRGQVWSTMRALAATTVVALLGLCLSGDTLSMSLALSYLDSKGQNGTVEASGILHSFV